MNSLKVYKYYLFLLIGIVVIYWPVSTCLFSLKNDALAGYFPAKYFISESINNKIIPWWNPYINYGYPMHADVTSTFWSPFTWFFSLTAGYSIYTVHLEFLLYCFLAAIGMFRLCLYFKQQNLAAFIIGLSYACSGIFSGNAQHTNWISAAALLPFLLQALLKFISEYKLKNTIVIALWVSLFIVTAHPYFIICLFYCFVALFFCFYRKSSAQLLTVIGHLLLSITMILLFTAGYLFSVFELLPYLTRGTGLTIAETSNSFTPISAISFILPFSTVTRTDLFGNSDLSMRNGYMGLIGFCFLLLMILNKKNYIQKVFIGIGIFFLLLSFGGPLTGFFTSNVPLFGFIRLISAFRVFAIFFLLLSTSFTLDSFMKGEINREKLRIILKFIMTLIGAGLIFTVIKIRNDSFGFSFPSFDNRAGLKLWLSTIRFEYAILIQGTIQLVLLFIFFLKCRKLSYSAILFICLLDLFMATNLNLPFTAVGQKSVSEIQNILNEAPKGFPEPKLKPVKNNTQASVQTDKILGNWSMYNKEPGTATMQKTYPNLLNDNQLYFKSGLNEVYKNTGFIFFAKSVTYYIDSFLITEKDSATCFINKKDINADFKNNITEYSGGTIKIKSILPNTFRFTTNTNAENLLILKQNNYKHWSASIDGKLTQIISSSYTFMAIKVPPGSHEITFSYSPDLAIKLGILNVTSCIIFILYVIFISQKTKRVSLS